MPAGPGRQAGPKPEPVPWLDLPGWRTGHRSGVRAAPGFLGPLGGPGYAVVSDLAMQHLIVFPDPQPAAAAAVAHHIGGELVHGDYKGISTALWQAGPAG